MALAQATVQMHGKQTIFVLASAAGIDPVTVLYYGSATVTARGRDGRGVTYGLPRLY